MKYANKHLYNESEVIATLRDYVREHGSQREFAALVGISVSYLNDMLKRKRRINDLVLRAMGFQRVEYYRQLVRGDK